MLEFWRQGLLCARFEFLVEFLIGGDGIFDGGDENNLEIVSYRRMIDGGIPRAVVVVVVRGATSNFLLRAD